MASVLNPEKHPRIEYREGNSLEKAGYQIEYLWARKPFRKDTFTRLRQQFHFLGKVLQFKPRVVHIHTPELGWIAVLLKLIFRYKLIYDRHEDYPRQVKYGVARNRLMQNILSKVAAFTETVLFQQADAVFLAEPGYQAQAPGNAILIRNSFLIAETIQPQESAPYFLICGALSQRNGVKEACVLWEELRKETPWKLHISGHSQEPALTRFLTDFQKKYPNEVRLNGINEPLPYAVLQNEIFNCSCGIALFQPSPHLQGKIPSRFYEFISFRKKLILSGNAEWKNSGFPENVYYLEKSDSHSLSELVKWLSDAQNLSYDLREWAWENDEKILLRAYEVFFKP